ncbi:hypothetical protein [Luteimonas sp. R10]|uniref:hypothetical protein n=1 Tax=Luteimonas sp. R10 TaxID=3108176 RepID=UPI00308B83D5|nr:hypothetical protein U3649_17130 [Luteimonas sp. R10]
MRLLIALAMAAMLAACSTVPRNTQGWIEPVDAVRAANDDPLNGVRGHFVLTVKALNSYSDRTFLNSERDYRDQRNLTVKMPTSMVPSLEQRLGVGLQGLKNRRLVVLGVAKRVRIDFLADGRPTGKYYYQTHVQVDSPTQVSFAD